jgi:hypothetical protein
MALVCSSVIMVRRDEALAVNTTRCGWCAWLCSVWDVLLTVHKQTFPPPDRSSSCPVRGGWQEPKADGMLCTAEGVPYDRPWFLRREMRIYPASGILLHIDQNSEPGWRPASHLLAVQDFTAIVRVLHNWLLPIQGSYHRGNQLLGKRDSV